MLVYRLEDANGCGPYGWGDSSAYVGHCLGDYHGPFFDCQVPSTLGRWRWHTFIEDCHRKGWKYAFDSLDKLQDLIVSDELAHCGFRIVEIRARMYVKFPDGQMLFRDHRNPLTQR